MHSLNFSFVCSFGACKRRSKISQPCGECLSSPLAGTTGSFCLTPVSIKGILSKDTGFVMLYLAVQSLLPNSHSPLMRSPFLCDWKAFGAIQSEKKPSTPLPFLSTHHQILTCIQRACKAFNWKQRVKNQYAGSIKNNGKQWSRSIFHIHWWVWLLHMSLARFSVHFTIFLK